MEKGLSNGHLPSRLSELRPTQYLEDNSRSLPDQAPAALIILNTPISDYKLLEQLHGYASFTVCADGGANRLHDLLVNEFPDQKIAGALQVAKPDAIHGDLDSLREDVRKRYEQIDVDISEDSDQYSTDFAKTIKKTIARLPDVQDVLILGSLGGRVDQGIGLLHEMYREQKYNHPDLRLLLFSESSISVVLQPGTTKIHTPLKDGIIKRNVGILPLYGKASITLKGFEWDVEDWPTEMGGQSSANSADELQWMMSNTTNDERRGTPEAALRERK